MTVRVRLWREAAMRLRRQPESESETVERGSNETRQPSESETAERDSNETEKATHMRVRVRLWERGSNETEMATT